VENHGPSLGRKRPRKANKESVKNAVNAALQKDKVIFSRLQEKISVSEGIFQHLPGETPQNRP
jgi:hypothetical protein